jgi:chemotaxis methyl-accepting protein methylase
MGVKILHENPNSSIEPATGHDHPMSGELPGIIEVMRQTRGRDVGCHDESFLARTVAKRMAATACRTTANYSSYLSENLAEAEKLLEALSVTFSEFFRNSLAFALLEHLVLPRLLAEKRKASGTEIRVWSAGCAAGQEAYSLAILLDELTTAPGDPISFRIFATDISEAALAAAREGVYDTTAVQQVRLRHLRECFTQEGETYRVCFRLRDRVHVSPYDLLDERSSSPPPGIYGDFDLIVCSNLLLYYRPEVRQAILARLHRALAATGYLVTGEAERGIVEQSVGFQTASLPAAVFQKAPATSAPGNCG